MGNSRSRGVCHSSPSDAQASQEFRLVNPINNGHQLFLSCHAGHNRMVQHTSGDRWSDDAKLCPWKKVELCCNLFSERLCKEYLFSVPRSKKQKKKRRQMMKTQTAEPDSDDVCGSVLLFYYLLITRMAIKSGKIASVSSLVGRILVNNPGVVYLQPEKASKGYTVLTALFVCLRCG